MNTSALKIALLAFAIAFPHQGFSNHVEKTAQEKTVQKDESSTLKYVLGALLGGGALAGLKWWFGGKNPISTPKRSQQLKVDEDEVDDILKKHFDGYVRGTSLSNFHDGKTVTPIFVTEVLKREDKKKVVTNKSTFGLRYPHLILHLLKLMATGSINAQTVYILGPGLTHENSIPQLHELMYFLSNSHIHVVDLSSEVLESVFTSQFSRTDRVTSHSIIDSEINGLSEGNQDLLRCFIESIPSDEHLPSHIQTIEADFANLEIEENSVDLMFATASLTYAVEAAYKNGDLEKAKQIIKKILSSIRRGGGRLYVDATFVEFLKILGLNVNFSFELIPSYSQVRIMGAASRIDYLGLRASTNDIYVLQRR